MLAGVTPGKTLGEMFEAGLVDGVENKENGFDVILVRRGCRLPAHMEYHLYTDTLACTIASVSTEVQLIVRRPPYPTTFTVTSIVSTQYADIAVDGMLVKGLRTRPAFG